MQDDCLERGRNMHAGGIRYHDYGITPLALPNVADGLIAIKKAVFDDKICTADELIEAMKVNFEGHEKLRAVFAPAPNTAPTTTRRMPSPAA
jgi:formate C-acetyltransferase